MKKVLLLLAAILSLSLSAHADVAVIKASNVSYSGSATTQVNATSNLTGNAISGVCSLSQSGGLIDAASFRIYANTTLTITPETGVTISKIIFKGTDTDKNVSKLSLTSNTGSYSASNNEGTWIGTTTAAIKFKATAQARVGYFEVTYTKESQGGGDVTTKPELPEVTFNGKTAENGKSYEVASGTTVTISSAGATSLYYFDDEFNEETINASSTTVTITKARTLYITAKNANGESEIMEVSFTIKQGGGQPTGNTYQLIKSVNDLEAGAYYVIGTSKSNVVMSTTNPDKQAEGISCTIRNEKLTAGEGVLVLKLEGSTGNWKWVNAANTAQGLNMSAGSPDLKFGTATATTVSITTAGNATIKSLGSATTARQILYSTSAKVYKNYASSNAGSTTYPYTQIYKLVVETPVDPVDFVPEIGAVPALYPEDKHQIVIANEAKPATFTFESKNPEIATVSETGEITAVAEGTATFTISWEGDKTWNAGSKDITVEVKKALADPGLWFRHPEVHGKINVGVVAQAVHHKSPGKITYSSSNESVVTVSATTGMITPGDVHSVGTAVITATIEATEEYRSGSLSYTVVIEAPEYGATAPAGNAMFDFRNNNAYGMLNFTDSNSEVDGVEIYESNRDKKDGNTPVTEITAENIVTLGFEYPSDVPTYRLWEATKGLHLRHYNGSLVFTVPTGYSIEKILLNGEKFYNNSCTYTCSIGSFVVGALEGEQDVTAYWIDTDNLNPTTVKLTRSGTGKYIAIKTCTVIIKKSESDRTIADLKFDKRIYNTYVNEDTEVNAVTSPNLANIPSKNIKYSIDNLTGDDYFIGRESEADGKLLVNVKTPGVYTLRVKSDATETLLPGVAILRLNVFPKVELEHNAEEVTDGLMIVPAEGGKVKFGELPSTVALMVKRNGDAEFKAHDGSELTFADDDNLEYYMEYAETYRHGESKLEVVVRPTVPTHDEATGTHTFAPSKGAMLYHTALTVENMAKMMAPAADGTEWTKLATDDVLNVNPADYNLTDGQRLAFKAKSVKVASNGTEVAGPEKRFAILSNGQLSGVEDVEIEAEGAVRFYNLNGVEVDAADMAPGMYIRRSGSKAEKVVIK